MKQEKNKWIDVKNYRFDPNYKLLLLDDGKVFWQLIVDSTLEVNLYLKEMKVKRVMILSRK